jgi:hypothetical protein
MERHEMVGLGGVHCGELGHALEKAGTGERMTERERERKRIRERDASMGRPYLLAEERRRWRGSPRQDQRREHCQAAA